MVNLDIGADYAPSAGSASTMKMTLFIITAVQNKDQCHMNPGKMIPSAFCSRIVIVGQKICSEPWNLGVSADNRLISMLLDKNGTDS